jgi:hypothetical protein
MDFTSGISIQISAAQFRAFMHQFYDVYSDAYYDTGTP